MLFYTVLTVWTGVIVAHYDKTIRMKLVPGFLANVNDYGVSIVDRSFIHFNIHSCTGIYLSLQTTWNVTFGKHLIAELRPEVALLYDCTGEPEPGCIRRPTKAVEMSMYTCNVTFLLKLSWTDNGDFEFSRGESLDDEGKHLISCGGGPSVEKLFSYKTTENMKMLYLAFGPLGSGQLGVNVTYSTQMPHQETKSLNLVIPESVHPNRRVHRLREFHMDEVIEVVNVTSDPAILAIQGVYMILIRPLDYETKRTHVFEMILKGDVLTLKLLVVLRVQNVIEHLPHIDQARRMIMLEELPVGTILMPFVNVVELEAGEEISYELKNNSYFSINNSTGNLKLLKRVDRDAPGNVNKIPIVMKIQNQVGSRKIGFNITIIDINDNPPTFERGLHRVEMPFSSNATSNVITRFKLTDRDINTGLELQIEEGNPSLFYLMSDALCVHLDKLMNVASLRENDWTFTVTVAGRDRPRHGSQRQSFSTVFLLVKPPEDLDSSVHVDELPSLQVPEDSPIGQVVLQLKKVLKLPTKYNQGYQFSVHSSESECENGKLGTDYFGIDQYNGNVMVGAKLDSDLRTHGCTEMILSFNITNVLNGDSDILANINITIKDVNDNPPTFQETVIDVLVPCHLETVTSTNSGEDVTTNTYYNKEIPIRVSDVESDVYVKMEQFNWNHFLYNLTHKNADLWSLEIWVQSDMQFDTVDGDVALLLAVDGGVPPLTSTALVVIRQVCNSYSSSGQAHASSPSSVAVHGSDSSSASSGQAHTSSPSSVAVHGSGSSSASSGPAYTSSPSSVAVQGSGSSSASSGKTNSSSSRQSSTSKFTEQTEELSEFVGPARVGISDDDHSSDPSTIAKDQNSQDSFTQKTSSTKTSTVPPTPGFPAIYSDTTKVLDGTERQQRNDVKICRTYKIGSTIRQTSSLPEKQSQPSDTVPTEPSVDLSESTLSPCCPCIRDKKTSRAQGERSTVKYTLIAFCVIFTLLLICFLACCIRRKVKEKQNSFPPIPLDEDEQERSDTGCDVSK